MPIYHYDTKKYHLHKYNTSTEVYNLQIQDPSNFHYKHLIGHINNFKLTKTWKKNFIRTDIDSVLQNYFCGCFEIYKEQVNRYNQLIDWVAFSTNLKFGYSPSSSPILRNWLITDTVDTSKKFTKPTNIYYK